MGRREILTTDEFLPSWDGRDIVDLLDVATVAPGRFRSRLVERNEHGHIYGGQMLGQSVAAAARTAPPDRPPSYLQFLFVAGGLPELAIDYEVAPLQDGKRFASRNVRGSQPGGRIVCDASVSFANRSRRRPIRRRRRPTAASIATPSAWRSGPSRRGGSARRVFQFTLPARPEIALRQ